MGDASYSVSCLGGERNYVQEGYNLGASAQNFVSSMIHSYVSAVSGERSSQMLLDQGKERERRVYAM